jgi:hypothetical protein
LLVSKGADDTWEKVKDGTLSGASNVQWQTRCVAGQEVPVAQRYDLVELSLVDLASNPDAPGVTFVRDAVPYVALMDDFEALVLCSLPLWGKGEQRKAGDEILGGDAAWRAESQQGHHLSWHPRRWPDSTLGGFSAACVY